MRNKNVAKEQEETLGKSGGKTTTIKRHFPSVVASS